MAPAPSARSYSETQPVRFGCQMMRLAAGWLVSSQQNANITSLTTEGIDINVTYGVDLSDWGSINVDYAATILDTLDSSICRSGRNRLSRLVRRSVWSTKPTVPASIARYLGHAS